MKIELKNENIMIEAIERESEEQTKEGIYLIKQTLDEDQVAEGVVIESNHKEYKKGDILYFHKIFPVDIQIKLKDELKRYWFIKSKDIICKITK